MAVLTRPGVYVDQSAFPTYVSATPGTASACFIGVCPRGPLTPTVVTSWKSFCAAYGGFETAYAPSSLHLAVYCYFAAGGTSAVIIRVTTSSSAPVAANKMFNDSATGTPLATLQVVGDNPGRWGNYIFVDITPGSLRDPSAPTGSQVLSFNIVVHYCPPAVAGGPAGTPSPANIVEVWPDVSMVSTSMNAGTNNYALNVVNSPYTGSNYITLVDQHSATAAPANNPAPTNGVQLTGGLDGPGSPPANPPVPQATDFQNAFNLLNQFPDQPFVVNLCGQWDPTMTGPIVGLAQTRGDCFVVLDCPPAYTPTAMTAWAITLGRSDKAAVYYPQVIISDPYSPQAGITRTVPPGGYVVGNYIATDATRGVGKAPAGLGASLLGVYGVESTGVLTNTDMGNLNQAMVNCLISVPGSGVVVWGARTLSQYLVTRYVPVTRTLIYLTTQIAALTKFAVFEPNDWVLWNLITSVLTQFLGQFWQSGGLSGTSATEAYYVICDATNNTSQSIQNGIINVEVGVSLQYPAEFVVIKIGQWAGGQSVSVATS
jgi:hypothetical protein